MSDEALKAVEAQEPSQPTEEVKKTEEQGEAEAETVETKAEETQDEPTPKTVEELSAELESTKKAMQKRIDRKTAATKQQEEQIQQLRKQLEAMPKATVDDAPKAEDFESYDEYEQALVEYKADQRANERLKEEKQKQLQEAQRLKSKRVLSEFKAKEAKFRETVQDYDEVFERGAEVMSDLSKRNVDVEGFTQAVMAFDNPPAILYELAKNESVLEDIVQMEPIHAIRELVKLEMTLQTPAKQVKEAPKPIKTVTGNGGTKPLSQRSGSDIINWVKS